jgi:two-component system nitrogen regulation sensor histidine kinase NtrY
LSSSPDALQGGSLTRILPEMSDLVRKARRRPGKITERQITLPQPDGGDRTLFVRVAAEVDNGQVIGFVVTFDDITELLGAQRKAAWADVARRIAHEIKNPLTPIQLSAERLKRKYLSQIKNEPEIFQICTDTIVRHVEDIGRMVDEFSSFARMPTPVMENADLGQLIEQALFLQRNAHPEIAFTFDAPEDRVVVACDSQQIGRALTNLLQNAIDALEGRRAAAGAGLPNGRIEIRLVDQAGDRAIVMEDNGPGLPKAERDRLTEPYVTTRQRGTGLGLAIVKKIMEDHGGDLRLENAPTGGAQATLIFPSPEDQATPVQKVSTGPRKKGSKDGA